MYRCSENATVTIISTSKLFLSDHHGKWGLWKWFTYIPWIIMPVLWFGRRGCSCGAVLLPWGSAVAMQAWFMKMCMCQINIHMNSRTRGLPAQCWIVTMGSVLYTSAVVADTCASMTDLEFDSGGTNCSYFRFLGSLICTASCSETVISPDWFLKSSSWRGGAVVSTIDSQKEGSGFESIAQLEVFWLHVRS